MTDPSQLDATLHLGKTGLTDAWVEQLREQVERRRLVKVKVLRAGRSGRSVKDLAAEIAQRAEVDLVEVRGGTAVFARRRP